jgi:DNA-binding NtrC family response regulator
VRELENVVERALIIEKGSEIGPDILPAHFHGEDGSVYPGEIPDDGIDLDELEAELIRRALEKMGGNQTKAAELLGLSRPTLIYRMEKYGIKM